MDATITITGNVGSDVELRTDDSNEWAYASFRIACTPRLLRNGTWKDADTTWLSVSCRNRALSVNVKSSLTKGDPVVVTGRLATQTWPDRATGELHERLLLEAVAVGHDLTRGVSSFRRTERPPAEPSTGEVPDQASDPDVGEQQAAHRAA